jgi:hypothetical protein
MKLSFKALADYARSPQGKQLVQRAKALNTAQNRKKAVDLAKRFRGGGKGTPPAR